VYFVLPRRREKKKLWREKLKITQVRFRFRFMVFNATVNNISVILWWSVLLVDVAGEYSDLYFTPLLHLLVFRGRRGRDRIVVGFTTTYAISAYHH
jgi:hypothetical protein